MPTAKGGTTVGRKNNSQANWRPRKLRRPKVRAAGKAMIRENKLTTSAMPMLASKPPVVFGSENKRKKGAIVQFDGRTSGKNQRSEKAYTPKSNSGAINTT